MRNLPGGRNQAKIVYGYNRVPKQQVNFVINDITKSLDTQSLEYHRDMFYFINSAIQEIVSSSGPPPVVYGEYDEDFITFAGETSKTKTFNTTFSSAPIVVVEIPSTADTENINFFVESVTVNNFTLQLSAEFTGQVTYRAIYSSTYPTNVQRNVLSAAYTYEAVAGYMELSGQTDFTASYGPLSGTPTNGWFTPFDYFSNDDAQVAVVDSGSFGLASVSGSLSSQITNRINFLVVKS